MEQPNPATASADELLRYADAQRQRHDSYAFEAGVLTAFVRALCWERDELRKQLERAEVAA